MVYIARFQKNYFALNIVTLLLKFLMKMFKIKVYTDLPQNKHYNIVTKKASYF